MSDPHSYGGSQVLHVVCSNKMIRVQTFTPFLAQYYDEGEEFLAHIVTWEETSSYQYEPENKGSLQNGDTLLLQQRRSSCLNHPPIRSCSFFFWDMNGPVLVHYHHAERMKVWE